MDHIASLLILFLLVHVTLRSLGRATMNGLLHRPMVCLGLTAAFAAMVLPDQALLLAPGLAAIVILLCGIRLLLRHLLV